MRRVDGARSKSQLMSDCTTNTVLPQYACRHSRALTALAVILPLTACSTVSDTMDMLGAGMRTVQEPAATSPYALMRISTDGFTRVQPGRACESAANPRGGIAVSASSIYIGARSLKDQVRGVAGVAPPGLASGEIRLAAGEPHVLSYGMTWRKGDWEHHCIATRSFVPVEGAHYQMLTSSDAASQRCGFIVMQLLPTPALVETAAAPKCPAS